MLYGKPLCADYVVFGIALVIPIIMALYYACIKKQKSNFEFLMANRNMSAIPMGFSLAANYLSAVIVTGKSRAHVFTI